MYKDKQVRELRQKLVETLLELDCIATLRFKDLDSDKLLNLRNVVYDGDENCTVVELTAETDSLPSHERNPVMKSDGEPTPYVPYDPLDDTSMDLLCALIRTCTPQDVARRLQESTINDLSIRLTGKASGSIFDQVWAIQKQLEASSNI